MIRTNSEKCQMPTMPDTMHETYKSQLTTSDKAVYTISQGWARDVKTRDRDAHLPRRDVCSSRDVIETLKYKFYWLQ